MVQQMDSYKIYNIHFNPKSKEGYFILQHVDPDLDYRDVNENKKINSIWKKKDQNIFYALTLEQESELQSEKFELVYLR